MSIDDILLYLAETGKAHYLILEEEDGYPTVYRPIDQSTKLNSNKDLCEKSWRPFFLLNLLFTTRTYSNYSYWRW